STDDVEVTVNALPVVSIDPVADLCEDNAVISLVGTPNGGTFSGNGITGDDFDPSLAGVGTHTITYEYTDGNTCENAATTTIVVKEVPNYTVSFTNPTTCGGTEGTITLTGLNAGDSYDVNYNNGIAVTYTADVNGEILITDLEAGTYTDFEVTLDGCPKLDNTIITLEDPDAPVVNAGLDEVLCENEEVTLTASNPDGATITWNNGVTDGTPFTPTVGTTTYTVTAVLNGCTSTDDVEVTVNALPVVSIDPVADLCINNDLITLSGNPVGGTFSGVGINGNNFDPSIAGIGTHIITYDYTDGNGCENSSTTTIVVNDIPTLSAETQYSVCSGENVTMTVDSPSSSNDYYWYFDEDLVNNGANYTIQDAGLMNDGNYILVAQNSNGCFVEMDVTLSVDICNINITEVFSPNGDGKNDYFVVENLSMYPNSELWIYNKWGAEVYNSSDYLNDWNGQSQNALNIGEEELPEGTYYYVLKLGGDISTPNAGNVYKGFVYLKR
ncbi:MAG TPA: gliding motility-associated C-terminal domain-containing protein, partial [Brumimicrobium sp.]|nr:gliding motility-associated C-terminal domain-containing protein [Brumimicrobium sp.]